MGIYNECSLFVYSYFQSRYDAHNKFRVSISLVLLEHFVTAKYTFGIFIYIQHRFSCY